MTVQIDLSGYTPEDLEVLASKIKEVKKEVKVSSKQRYQSALAELVTSIQTEAAEMNVAMNDVYKAVKAVVMPSNQYKHPTEAKTWTGRGKKPAWIQELLANGTELESLKVA